MYSHAATRSEGQRRPEARSAGTRCGVGLRAFIWIELSSLVLLLDIHRKKKIERISGLVHICSQRERFSSAKEWDVARRSDKA